MRTRIRATTAAALATTTSSNLYYAWRLSRPSLRVDDSLGIRSGAARRTPGLPLFGIVLLFWERSLWPANLGYVVVVRLRSALNYSTGVMLRQASGTWQAIVF
jgi:hypothetical protein